jgi:hypothetical protein
MDVMIILFDIIGWFGNLAENNTSSIFWWLLMKNQAQSVPLHSHSARYSRMPWLQTGAPDSDIWICSLLGLAPSTVAQSQWTPASDYPPRRHILRPLTSYRSRSTVRALPPSQLYDPWTCASRCATSGCSRRLSRRGATDLESCTKWNVTIFEEGITRFSTMGNAQRKGAKPLSKTGTLNGYVWDVGRSPSI